MTAVRTTPIRTTHSLIVTSPGQGTITELRDAADADRGHRYHYIATDEWVGGVTPIGRLDFLTDANNTMLTDNRVLIIDGFDLISKEERLSVIRLFELWMKNNPSKELAVKWVLITFNAALVLEITEELLPLVSGLWQVS